MSTIPHKKYAFFLRAFLFLLVAALLLPMSASARPDGRDRTDRSDSRAERAEVVEERTHETECENECGENGGNTGESSPPSDPYEDTTPPPSDEPWIGPRISLWDIGLLQLAAHDFFSLDRDTEEDSEDGKLNLSTLFDHGAENIAFGGEFRNRENIIIFTIASRYGALYEHFLNRGSTESAAKQRVLRDYHRDIESAYFKLFGESAPKAIPGEVTFTENLAYRTVHDILPGTIVVEGESHNLFDSSLFGKTLSDEELDAIASPLDGTIDSEFFNIVVFIPPSTLINVDLFERDSSFAEQFNTTHSFEHFLSELEDGEYDSNDDVMHLIRGLFAKGFYLSTQ